MLNKNDPLIGAVQEVMKRNQLERDAAKLVNEKFGVSDRKALPHEKQGAWDAAYKEVLSEGLHPNQQKLDVHEPEKDKLTKHDFKMLRAKKKTMEEDVTSPSAMGIKKPDYATDTPDYAKSKEQTVNRAAKTSLPAGTVKEAKVNPYAVGMAAVKKSTGDQPPMEKKNIMKAHKIAKKIIAKKKINEGFNNRHSLSEKASAEKQAVAAQLNEDDIDSYENRMTAGLGGFTPYGGGRFGGGVAKRSGSSSSPGTVKASNINTRTGEPFKPTAKPTKKYKNAADELSPASRAKFRKTLDAKMAAGGSPKNALKRPVAQAKAEKSSQSSQPGSQPGYDAAGNRTYNKAFTDLINQAAARQARAKAVSRPAKDIKADDKNDLRTQFLDRASGKTPEPRPAADLKTGNKNDLRNQFIDKTSSATPAARKARVKAVSRPAADLKSGDKKDLRTQFLDKANANKPQASATTSAAINQNRISAIRRPVNKTALKTSIGAGLALGTVATGGDPLGLDNTVASKASAPERKKKEITDRVPPAETPQRVLPQTLQRGAEQDKVGVKRIPTPAPASAPAAQSPAAQAPAKAKPVAPAATKPAAPAVAQAVRKPQDSSTPAQRAQFNRQIDRGNAAPGTQYKGLGVKTGTTIQQKAAPQVKKPVGMGRVK